MTQIDEYHVPSKVLMHMLHGVALDASQLILSSWHSPDIVHPGDPFGTVFLWLWRTDQDRATRLFSDVAWRVRHTGAGATKQITLNGLLNGLRQAAEGITSEELTAMRPVLIEWMRADHGEDPNTTD
ncbi:hypothetical protein [Paractinoplanes toevensis]|uniref:Uncharacterized protein n=1 Tax=Paractinoplanes toevensis TaxID=571911 RepID=A0A919T5I1_9ACTN|nr:hypothetical protein [Actinoplanes toevensis]GIM88737.1 hypothetical protein Ato02nite_005300 [Actinoplanes toevensis]